MLSKIFSSTRRVGIKPGRSVRVMMQIGLAMLALAIAASPAASAGAQPLAFANSGAGNNVGKVAGGQKAPNATCPGDGQCFADVPPSSGFYTFTNRIYMQDLVSGYACGGPGEPYDAENRPYYRPGSSVTRQQMAKFIDNARRLSQIEIEVESGAAPVDVTNNTGPAIQGSSVSSIGLFGYSDVGWGVFGTSTSSNGVYGSSTSGYGVNGVSTSGVGVRGTSNTTNGVQGVSTSGYGLQGTTATGPAGINGWNQGTGYGVEGRSDSAQGIALYGYSENGKGAEGRSANGIGVRGYSPNYRGVEGSSISNSGVYGMSTSSWGVYGESNGDSADAGVTGGATNARGVYGSSTNSSGVYAESYAGYGIALLLLLRFRSTAHMQECYAKS